MFIKLKSRYNGEIYLNVNHILKIVGYAKSVTELTFLNLDHVVLVEETPEEIMKLIEDHKFSKLTSWYGTGTSNLPHTITCTGVILANE